jgi:hypothetical protein
MHNLRPLLKLILIISASAWLAACGGSGSGSDEDSGPTSTSYAGNTDLAEISTSNAARLVGNIFVGQTIVNSSSGGAAKSIASIETSTRGIGLAHFPSHLTQKIRGSIQSSPSVVSRGAKVQARADVDETEPCDNADGSFHITGFVEDNRTGTLTLDYINCREGSETLDGSITLQVNVFDFGLLIPIDAIYSFSVLTLTTPTFSMSIDGSLHSRLFFGGGQTERLDISRLVSRDNATGEVLMITNQVSIIDYDNLLTPSSFSETIAGRIYDSRYGYVDFTTNIALNYRAITQEFPDSGQLLLIGSLNSGILATVISDTHIMLELDLDGDSVFEITVVLNWSEIETQPDLADSDGDGMHDSWEILFGLDPGVIDSNDDLDGDGLSNYQEYLNGTNP